jgi:hypothetical protein
MGVKNAILHTHHAKLAIVDAIYIQVETYKYVGHAEIKICLVHVTNVQLWAAHNALMVISN